MKHFSSKAFTLIEVLIALLILSVGMLGIAALQLKSLSYSADSQSRVTATYLAMDIIEKIRANAANSVAYVSTSAPTGVSCDEVASGASNDLACWYQNLGQALPRGRGSISGTTDSLQVTIVWGGRQIKSASGYGQVESFSQVWEVDP